MCLALFASSALAAPAPQLGQDTSALVDTILSQLDGTIDAAIQAALGGSGTKTKTVETPARSGLNFQGTFTQVKQPVKIGENLWSFNYLLWRALP